MIRASSKRKWIFLLLTACSGLLVFACSSKMKSANLEQLRANDEFDRVVKIVPGDSAAATPAASVEEKTTKGKKKKGKPVRGAKVAAAPPGTGPLIHEPADVEDGGTFVGRRPIKDPFWVGENVTLEVSYWKISAGAMTLKVDPYVQVNGAKAYSFVTEIQSYSKFAMIYTAEDKVTTFLDFDQLIPRVFTLSAKESSQLREAKSFFDFNQLKANYWEKKVTEKNGVEEKKQQWDILPYSQNVFSAIFYMRLFPWEDGKSYAFRVADDEQNLIFHGKTIRRETIETDLGPMKAVVVEPHVILKGAFKPMGKILIWLSDDDRKLVLRIEAEIKIGTLVAKIIKLDRGHAP